MKEGDRNTGFFHKQAEARRNVNFIQEIQAHGRLISNFEEIKEEATRHFKDLFTAQPVSEDVELLHLIPRAVNNKDNGSLKQPITMEEIRQAMDSMEEDRAPRPDGYNVNFVKICWNIIKRDLFKMIKKS